MSHATLNSAQLRDMFLFVAQTIVDNEEFLTEIDSKIGDGDHGTGMSTGFRNVLCEFQNHDFASPEDVFLTLGNTLLDTMGGASGVLFGTLFISGIVHRTPSSSPDTASLDTADFATIFRESLNALKSRGKANIGDKTMIDAFEPAVVSLEKSSLENLAPKEALALAAAAALKGVEYTKTIVARFGRARFYGENSLGLQDAGATSVWLIFQAMSDWCHDNIG